jgi:hypothetical protein
MKGVTMAKFFVIHQVATLPDSYNDWVDRLRAVRMRACGNSKISAAWLNSWYSPEEERMYCEWEADHPEDIQACLTEEDLAIIPLVSIVEVAHIDASWLDEQAS